ncbi:hypothetical protein GCM10027277_58020 [Pseudoduganella ginsengisoli]|uniref:Type 4 secretion system PilS N-terminal domain-containing protein n=1 Tax=Pseudoduganella ginsengisoli TaxID=1462440 RepID=A0A6L6Q8D3_9BURK|nr:hypothetical protein [Pseudoduganella ginsengisoli]MTW05890.1 hypothetical protein [Pseudoduganella ginsengisoli]
MKKIISERGFISIAILISLIFFGMASIALIWRSDIQRAESYIAEGSGLMQVRNALQKYAVANQQNFIQGKTVMYVNDQYAPTLGELTSLGYFTSTGVDMNPYGAGYITKLTKQANNSITGMAYINGSVKDSSGAVDQRRACGIAKALGDIGLCTNPVNSAMLGNLTTQIANPTGLPAVVAAQIYVAP